MEHSIFYGVKSNHAKEHLALSYCGISQTEANHEYGPSLTDSWVFHFVLQGKGEVFTENESYTLSAGDGFLIRPYSTTRYVSAQDNPWGYLWFGLNGSLIPEYLEALGIARDQAVFSVKNSLPFLRLLSQCLSHTSSSLTDELELNAIASRMLANLSTELRSVQRIPVARPQSQIVKDAIVVIVHEWRPGITASWVATRVNVNRSHLSRVFHHEIGLTIKEYIERIRLSHAHDMLGMTDMSIAEVAVECGYPNAAALTRNFHESQGFTPSEFRKSNTGMLNNLGLGIGFLQAAFGL
ncbi:MAG: AraC family transcriptional regulator [Bifidobacterium sp.]|nr:AraC family transcriptional regulator [Bifidobacterium sp.]MCH4174258.1 AraC family transcriptional regulator [Bifidobacterium sp.]